MLLDAWYALALASPALSEVLSAPVVISPARRRWLHEELVVAGQCLRRGGPSAGVETGQLW